jgi:parallel beta-helix repeat protein
MTDDDQLRRTDPFAYCLLSTANYRIVCTLFLGWSKGILINMESALTFAALCLAMAACSIMADERKTSTQCEENVMTRYNLSTFDLMDAQQTDEFINKLMVVQRMQSLRLKPEQFQNLSRWRTRHQESLQAIEAFESPVISFTGATAAELNSFLQANRGKTVKLVANVRADESILLPSNTILDGGGFMLDAHTDRVMIIKQAEQSAVRHLRFTGDFINAIYIADGHHILVNDVNISHAKGRPLVVMGGTHHLYLTDNTVEENVRGGIYIRGGVNTGLIANNLVRSNKESSNFSAGIVVTDGYVVDVDDPEKYDPHPIDQQLTFPHDLLLLHNRVTDQQSSGIYVDGAIALDIIENYIVDNDKEGTCLDNGTTGVQYINNTVMRNGRRIRQTDQDLQNDFVLRWGRLEDGSAASKLPGISLDNALYNILVENTIDGNYGSGIKVVRTGVRNIVGANIVSNNNAGENDRLHFYGIELGSAPLDEATPLLDATAAYENLIFSNRVFGSHVVGIFLAGGTYQNNIFNNTILGAKQWGIESSSALHNYASNNEYNTPIKGFTETNH